MRMRQLILVYLMSVGLLASAQQIPTAVVADPPVDKAHPASLVSFQIPSHGEAMNAIAYLAAGTGPHPVVLLLHGFPGNEKNLDLAQAIRRDGWDVVWFNYRGSWGSPGAFSFSHAIEDTQAAIAYIREPQNALRLHADPKRIVVIGHSMGGFMAAYTGSHDPAILGTGMISAANMFDWAGGATGAENAPANRVRLVKGLVDEDILPLAGCTGESLADDMLARAKDWDEVKYASLFGKRPLLVVTSDDGLAPSNNRLVEAMKAVEGSQVTAKHFATDHSYSDQRVALESQVIQWLDGLK